MASETYTESVARLNARIEELEAEIDHLQREVTATYQAYDDMMRCKDEDIAGLVKELNECRKFESEGWMALCAGKTLPEGVEWPRFEDGEPVKFGDLYVNAKGNRSEVQYIGFRPDGFKVNRGQKRNAWKAYGEPVKRPEPDTQEAIDTDLKEAFSLACEQVGDTIWFNDTETLLDRVEFLLERQRKLLRGE